MEIDRPDVLDALTSLVHRSLVVAEPGGGPGGGAGGGAFGRYSLVPPGPRVVANGRIAVTPPQAWNRIPRGTYDIREEENWTLNGPLLDSIGFIGGLRDGHAIVRQRRRDDRVAEHPQHHLVVVEQAAARRVGRPGDHEVGVVDVASTDQHEAELLDIPGDGFAT